MPEPLWRPSADRIANSNLSRFCAYVNSTLGTKFDPADYDSLYRWSIEQPPQFWQSLLGWSGLQYSGSIDPTVFGLEHMRPPKQNDGPYWFPNVEQNFAENLVGARASGAPVDGSSPAIISWNENGRHAWLTWDELHYRVHALSAHLAARGVGPGDRVAGFLPNIPESVIAMLATTSLGAVWSSCSPDFGVQGVIDRFGQITPKVLICADGYQYNGKYINSLARVREFLPQLPSVEHVIVAEYLQHEPDLTGLGDAIYLRSIVAAASSRRAGPTAAEMAIITSQLGIESVDLTVEAIDLNAARLISAELASNCQVIPFRLAGPNLHLAMLDVLDLYAIDAVRDATGLDVVPHTTSNVSLQHALQTAFGLSPLAFCPFPFNHPLYIMYSSGTTGLPKCMVHGVGGTLLQHYKELALHTDVKPGDRVFYFTTCGWMMWNWLVSSLALGATLVLYDGSPFAPRPDILWDMCEQEQVNVFGTSAKYLALLEKEGVRPREGRSLEALRCICSTGSPLAPDSFDFVYRDIKADVQLASISGGTDIISCFALGCPTAPVYRGELQCRGLGMKVAVFNEHGESVNSEQGELVCTLPFPSMPISFWDDPDGAKYRAAYFEHYPGVWRHGDWCELTDHADSGDPTGLVIYGRSDATLNPGGVRIGTAEIYRQVEQLPEIVESLVVGQDWDGDTRIVLFVRLRGDAQLDDALREKITRHIRANASPHHVPRHIVQVTDIPRTISGKIVELAVREVIHDRPVKNVDALANPDALEQYRDREELQS